MTIAVAGRNVAVGYNDSQQALFALTGGADLSGYAYSSDGGATSTVFCVIGSRRLEKGLPMTSPTLRASSYIVATILERLPSPSRWISPPVYCWPVTGANTYSGATTVTGGTLATGDTNAFTETYDNKNVGTGKAISVSGISISGGYEPVAEALLAEMKLDAYFLEYDDERSGDFRPLRFLPKGKTVVLGLVTTKVGSMESKDALKRRIEEASRYVPLEQLALSPQCGFSSTVHGNDIAVEAQRSKLRLVIETANEMWGES